MRIWSILLSIFAQLFLGGSAEVIPYPSSSNQEHDHHRVILRFHKSCDKRRRKMQSKLAYEGMELEFKKRRGLSEPSAIDFLPHLGIEIIHLKKNSSTTTHSVCSRIAEIHTEDVDFCHGDHKVVAKPISRTLPFTLEPSSNDVDPSSGSYLHSNLLESYGAAWWRFGRKKSAQFPAGGDSNKNLLQERNETSVAPETPDDPGFMEQWGLLSSLSDSNFFGIDGPGAWELLRNISREGNALSDSVELVAKAYVGRANDGSKDYNNATESKESSSSSNIAESGSFYPVIAVIDSGADYNHQDLEGVIWVNEAEQNGVPGVDDDNNGFIDDIYGYDFRNDDGDPMDDDGHGTHVTGIIAANGNNGKGIAGIAWAAKPKIMPLKFMGKDSADPTVTTGWTSDAIRALDYAITMGAHITCNSWGGGPYDWGLEQAIQKSADINQLFVVAAGNEQVDLDRAPQFPAGFAEKIRNVINVGSTDRKGGLLFDSNYGLKTVHLGAPGERILSTVLDGKYAYYSGTSMAAPFVAGVAAMILQLHPKLVDDFEYIRMILLETVQPLASLRNRTVTGGQLDAKAAMSQAIAHMNESNCFFPQTDFWGYDVVDDNTGSDKKNSKTDGHDTNKSNAIYDELISLDIIASSYVIARNPHWCQKQCQKREDCAFWTLNSFKQCWLKKAGAGKNRIFSHGSMAGPKYCGKEANNNSTRRKGKNNTVIAEVGGRDPRLPLSALVVPGCLEVNVARGTREPTNLNSFHIRVESPFDCLQKCFEDDQCKGWTFYESSLTKGYCFVQYSMFHRVPLKGAVSSYRPRSECVVPLSGPICLDDENMDCSAKGKNKDKAEKKSKPKHSAGEVGERSRQRGKTSEGTDSGAFFFQKMRENHQERKDITTRTNTTIGSSSNASIANTKREGTDGQEVNDNRRNAMIRVALVWCVLGSVFLVSFIPLFLFKREKLQFAIRSCFTRSVTDPTEIVLHGIAENRKDENSKNLIRLFPRLSDFSTRSIVFETSLVHTLLPPPVGSQSCRGPYCYKYSREF